MCSSDVPKHVVPPAVASCMVPCGVHMCIDVPQISQLNIIAKIVLVFASTLPAVFAFGALYSAITSTEWKAACLKVGES